MRVARHHQPTRAAGVFAATMLAAVGIGGRADAASKPKQATTISGVVWADGDGDGIREQGELPLGGAKVTIARKSGKSFRTAKTLTTSKTGGYSYRVRKAGQYRISVALPPGFGTFSPADQGNDRTDSDLLSTGLSKPLTLRVGGASKRLDAGLRKTASSAPLTDPGTTPTPAPTQPTPTPPDPTASTPDPPAPTTPAPPTPVPTSPTTVALGDIVWSDTDQDGRREAGEPGLAGVRVELLSSVGAIVAQTDSSATGTFSLTGTIGTSYRLRVVLPTGTVFSPTNVGLPATDSDINRTGPATGFSELFTASASLPKFGVGISSPGTSQLGNFVFQDVDGNGIYSADPDREFHGATVTLWNESRSQVIASTTTSTVGAYALQAPRGVNYYLQFTAPSFYVIAPQNAGTDDGLDSDIEDSGPDAGFTALFAVGAGPISTIDAGFIQPINLGDRVWDDIDADGLQDAGEPGLAGITVQLWNAAKTKLYSQTTSSASGTYQLKAPGAMSYRIRALLPSGAAFSPKQVGSDEQKDSDINPASVNIGFTDVLTLAPNLISASNIDIGIDQP